MSSGTAEGPVSICLTQKPVLSLELAQIMVAAAIAEAKANNWNVTVSILDDGANLINLAKMDGCQLGSVAISQEKAAAALRFKRPTKVLQDFVKEGNIHMLGLPGIIPVEGGVPIVINDHVVGAIGISGVTSVQDSMIAAAALSAVARLDITIA